MRCPSCNTDLLGEITTCPKCGLKIRETKEEIRQREISEARERIRIKSAIPELKQGFLSTTSNAFYGYAIDSYLGIKSGEAVLGTGFMSELSAAVNDFAGTTSGTMTNKIVKAKELAINALIDNCIIAGANAVVGVSVDITVLSGNLIAVSATGTAVSIRKA